MHTQSLNADWLLSGTPQKALARSAAEGNELLVKGRKSNFYDPLFSVDDAQELLSRRDLFYPFIRLYNGGKRMDVASYTRNLRFSGSDTPFFVPSNVIFDELKSGATAYFTGIERISKACLALKIQLEETLNAVTDLSLFVTPPNTVGNLPRHYDNVDGLILQISGKKRWKLWDMAVEDPLLVEKRPDVSATSTDNNIRADYVLVPGDLLFVPAGMVHETDTTDDHSIHITIGVTPFRWYNLASDYLASAIGGDTSVENASLNSGIHHLMEKIRSGRYPSRPGMIQALLEDGPVDNNTGVAWANWVPTSIIETGDKIQIRFHGNTLVLPKACRDLILALRSSREPIQRSELKKLVQTEDILDRTLGALMENGVCVSQAIAT